MTKNSIIEKLVTYKPEKYSVGITNAKLAAVALLKLEENNIEKTFENIVVAVQKLFPGKFSLITYPDIPDTIRIDNTLRLDAGNHAGYIKGNRPKGYKLTATGRVTAEETTELLDSTSYKFQKKSFFKDRNRYTRLVSGVISTEAYQKFTSHNFAEINKLDSRRVLHCTLETSEEKVLDNLDALISICAKLSSIKEYEKQANEVLEFLNYLKSNWDKIQNE